MALRTKTVKAGDWRTLESFWNVTTTAFFRHPSGARIRVRYGGGWPFSSNKQNQTLNGETIRTLSVGRGSLVYARMQMRVDVDRTVTYDVWPGSVAVSVSEGL